MDTLVTRKLLKNIESRAIAIMAIVAQVIYLSAIINGFNYNYPIVSFLFIAFQVITFLCFVIYIINNWTVKVPKRKVIKPGYEQEVAVIIPTWNEPVGMVERTVLSVINQDYPLEKLVVIVSDDARNYEMKSMVFNIASQFPGLRIIYNIPPEKDSTSRKGEGKSGNLNSALRLIQDKFPEIEYIETRDADDLVGSKEFLRDSTGQLMFDDKLAYVQSIKQVKTSEGDPFGNQEEIFFRSLMLYKNGANAVFPCGSGLVWRKTALLDIGGLPTWNLVEDFQSGAEALRRGWKGMYLPIVGAIGQIAPEDILNMYKQRGTWAMDSFRFFLWGNKKGLSIRQRLHFAESTIAYALSIMTFFYAFLPAIFLIFGIKPTIYTSSEFVLFQLTQVLSVTLFSLCLASRGEISAIGMMKSSQTLFGAFPAIVKALFLAIIYGPNKKPRYKVTRKNHVHGIYIHKVLPQIILVATLVYAIYWNIVSASQWYAIDFSNILWAVYFIYIYKQVIANSVHKWTDIFKGFKFFRTKANYNANIIA
jgi:cellulose synthase (UDP-forming)